MNSLSVGTPYGLLGNIIPFDDPIVAEVRQARREILDSFGGDYKAMLRDVRRRQDERKQNDLDPANLS